MTQSALPITRISDPADLPFVTDPGERRGDMLYRRFGRTDEMISAIGMGGFHLGKNAVSDDEAVRLVHEGVDRGIQAGGNTGWLAADDRGQFGNRGGTGK